MSIADIVLPSTLPNLFIAPARIGLAKLEARLVGELDAHFKLKDKIAQLDGAYSHIVIDCPPALGLLTVNALVAATHLLIPIQSSYFALEGTDDLLETIEKVRQRPNPALRILGVAAADPALLERETVEVVVQINGKLRDRMDAPADATREQLEKMARERPRAQAHIDGNEVVKVVVVPGRLVNFVVR